MGYYKLVKVFLSQCKYETFTNLKPSTLYLIAFFFIFVNEYRRFTTESVKF